MISLDEIVFQKAIEQFRELYERFESSEMTVQEFKTTKEGILGPLAPHRDNVPVIRDYRRLLGYWSRFLTGRINRAWIDEVVEHERIHSTAALAWAQSQGVRISSEFGVYLLTKERELRNEPLVIGVRGNASPFRVEVDKPAKKIVLSYLQPYGDSPDLAEVVGYDKRRFLDFHRAVYNHSHCGRGPR